jgi:hypothetical protein
MVTVSPGIDTLVHTPGAFLPFEFVGETKSIACLFGAVLHGRTFPSLLWRPDGTPMAPPTAVTTGKVQSM